MCILRMRCDSLDTTLCNIKIKKKRIVLERMGTSSRREHPTFEPFFLTAACPPLQGGVAGMNEKWQNRRRKVDFRAP